MRREAALLCIQEIHRPTWLKTLGEVLSPLLRSLAARDELIRAVELVHVHTDVASALTDDQRIRLAEVVFRLPAERITMIDGLLEGPFAASAKKRVERMTALEVADVEFFSLPAAVTDRIVEAYSGATSFDDANTWAKRLQANVSAFSLGQLKTIARISIANTQIIGSFQLPHTLAAIKRAKVSDEELGKRIDDAEMQML